MPHLDSVWGGLAPFLPRLVIPLLAPEEEAALLLLLFLGCLQLDVCEANPPLGVGNDLALPSPLRLGQDEHGLQEKSAWCEEV